MAYRAKSIFIEALEELGGAATATELRDYLRGKGFRHYMCADIHKNMNRLRHSGKVKKTGRASFSLVKEG